METPPPASKRSDKDLDISTVFFMNEIFNTCPGYTVIIKPGEFSGECTILNDFGKQVSYSSSIDLSTAVLGAIQGFMLQKNPKFDILYQQEMES